MTKKKTTDTEKKKSDKKKKTSEKKSLEGGSDFIPDYYPIIVGLDKTKNNIFNSEGDIKFSTNVDYPRCEYGFHHFLHADKNRTEILSKFEGKKKVYLVMNMFERYIDNYDEGIGNVSKKYFKLDDKPDILSRGFYKLWEILMMYNLIDVTNDKFVSAHLAEGPGSFIQATMFYRDLFTKNNISKNDKYHAITLHSEEASDNYVPKLEDKFIEYYNKEKPKRFLLHETYPIKETLNNKNKDNGDLTDPKTIKLFSAQVSKVDLVTADGGFDWVNENLQEQESYRLVLAEIITAFKIQKKGGHFVCKIFETFTRTSMKIIAMLEVLYEDIHFVKPLTSKPSNSEKYVVCMKFKYSDNMKEYKEMDKKLDDMMEMLQKNKTDKIVDLFSEYEVSRSLITKMITVNVTIANQQIKNISEIVKFVEKDIYSGDEYHDNREKQKIGAKYWTELFFNKTNKQKCEYLKYFSQTQLQPVYDRLVSTLVPVQAQN